MKGTAALVIVILAWSPAHCLAGSDAGYEPNAVLINLTESDLNRIVRASFRSNGAGRLEGARDRVSKGILDLRYDVELSEPVLRLGRGGRARIGLDIERGNIEIGRIERRIGRRVASCEDAGLAIDPDRPVDVELSVRFRISDGRLRVLAESVDVPNRDNLRLVKPSRCRNAILPTWLIWLHGKSRLRKNLGRLEDLLLTRAGESVGRLDRDEGFLARRWSFGGPEGELAVYPRRVETAHRSLFLTLAGSAGKRVDDPSAPPEWTSGFSDRTYLALSSRFLNRFLELTFTGLSTPPRKPSGSLSRLVRSSAMYTLLPGARELGSPRDLRFSLTFHDPPRIEFVTRDPARAVVDPRIEMYPPGPDAGRAMIRIVVSGIELGVWQETGEGLRRRGTLLVDSGTIGLVPFVNILDGVSFQLVENRWRLSSRGLEFNEPLIAATIQEMIFAGAFQSRYDPFWRGAFRFEGEDFTPLPLRVIGDHLVIEPERGPLPAGAPLPAGRGTTRTGIPLASR